MNYFKQFINNKIIYVAIDDDLIWATTNEDANWVKAPDLDGWNLVKDQFEECKQEEIRLVIGKEPR